jgi:hypothetical protein
MFYCLSVSRTLSLRVCAKLNFITSVAVNFCFDMRKVSERALRDVSD